MLQKYVAQLREESSKAKGGPRVREIRLLSKAHLVPLYHKAVGFEHLGPSSVHHGQDVWEEMRLVL